MPSLDDLIHQLRRAAARARAARYLVHALLGLCAWLCVVLLVSRLAPVESARLVALYGLPVPFVLAGILWVLLRPSSATLARVADIRLGLRERLSTAWERRGIATPIDELQRRDALQRTAGKPMAAAFPVRVQRVEAGLVAGLAIFALILSIVPNPQDKVLAQHHADRASQTRAAATLKKTEDQIKQADPAKRTPVDPEVQKILDDVAARIQKADNPGQALQSISPAEEALARIPDPQIPQRVASAGNLSIALSRTAAGRAASKALASSPEKGADALKELGSQLAGLSEKDRADLAKALAEAAKHSPDVSMRDATQKAADALNRGDLAGGSTALGELSDQLRSLSQGMNEAARAQQAMNALESARAELAEQADRDAGRRSPGENPSTVQPLPNARERGSGNNPGGSNPGRGNNPGSGNNPGGPGQGSGSAGGSGQGSGSGGQGSGSGTGSGAGDAGLQPKDNVFVPGVPVPSQMEDEPAPLGPGQKVPLRPYTDVLGAYQQAALDVIDRSLIPGFARDLVREYFSSLGEPGGGS